MTDSPIAQTILKYAYTKVEAEKLLSLFRELCEACLYQQIEKTSLESLVREKYKNTADVGYYFEALPELIELIDQTSHGKFSETLARTTQAFETVPTLILYVPIRFEHQQLKTIGTWVRQQVSQQALLQLIVNPEYRGGCGISWKGVIKDYSFNHFFTRESRSILSLIQHV